MKDFSVAYYYDVELNAGARDASFTCAITVTLASSSGNAEIAGLDIDRRIHISHGWT